MVVYGSKPDGWLMMGSDGLSWFMVVSGQTMQLELDGYQSALVVNHHSGLFHHP